MLTNKTINVSATSKLTVTTGEKEESVVVMTLSGNLNASGKYAVNRYIENPELYKANKAQMNADVEEFEAMLLAETE